MDLVKVGERIKKYRKKYGFTQSELAREVNVNMTADSGIALIKDVIDALG